MGKTAFGSVIKYIVISFLIFVLTVNLSLFVFSQDGLVGNEIYQSKSWLSGVFDPTQAHYQYKGFYDFFDFMRTFPGLNISLNALNEFIDIISFRMPNANALDALINIFKVISLPVNLLISFVVDIVNIVTWIFGYFIPYLL